MCDFLQQLNKQKDECNIVFVVTIFFIVTSFAYAPFLWMILFIRKYCLLEVLGCYYCCLVKVIWQFTCAEKNWFGQC